MDSDELDDESLASMSSSSSSDEEEREESFRVFVDQKKVVGQSAWADLPEELLEHIIELLSTPLDRAAVSLVCASWRVCLLESYPPSDDLPFEVPRLLIRRPRAGSNDGGGELAFFSLHHNKFFPLEMPAFLRGGRCCGSTIDGSILLALDSERSIVAFNHVSRRVRDFPRLPPVFPVKKVILSHPPDHKDKVAAVLGGTTGTIAVLKKDVSRAWMTVGIKVGQRHGGFRDIAFWGDGRQLQLCALAHDGAVFAFRFDASARAATVSRLRDPEDDATPMGRRWWKLFLVVTGQDLVVVRKLYRSLVNGQVQRDAEVIVLTSPEDRVWEKVDDMPGSALFVGSVASIPVPLRAYPDSGLRGGSVYFAHKEVERLTPHAISEYSVLNRRFRGVPVPSGHNADVEPVWINPCFPRI